VKGTKGPWRTNERDLFCLVVFGLFRFVGCFDYGGNARPTWKQAVFWLKRLVFCFCVLWCGGGQSWKIGRQRRVDDWGKEKCALGTQSPGG